jgi:uncharacterized protein with ParB-like and HNH nuclease domain
MGKVTIHGSEYPLEKVFSNDFLFNVPNYQRPYAWTTEHAGELLDDLLGSMPDSNESIEELNPYFLGSIVLIKGDDPQAFIVDGQQRLTTLTILLSVLRNSLPDEYRNDLTIFLCEQGNLFSGTTNRYRVTLRERDAQFFKEHIQDEGGIQKLRDLNPAQLSDSQQNIRDNALWLVEHVAELSETQRIRLAQFIVKRCFLVVVSTPDLDSAYRIFSVLNDRGLDLAHTDILKAELIGKTPESQQAIYTKKWEDAEEEVGREVFKDLFAHIRMIYRKQKPRETILKEFRNYVLGEVDTPQHFIDQVLMPYAEAFDDINKAAYESDRLSRCAEVLSTFQSADLPMFLLKIGSPKVERTSDDLLSRKNKLLFQMAATD